MPYGPVYGVHWAVNGFVEDQRISPEEAVRAATAGSAFAAFEEDDKGTLEPGKLADFVILNGDPFETPEAIARMRVASTWIGGRRVYAASPKSWKGTGPVRGRTPARVGPKQTEPRAPASRRFSFMR